MHPKPIAPKKEISKTYRNYVLAMLTLVYIFNFIDRQVLVILQESIKKELQLSDTQLGVLSGLTFALFYVILGIPIARLADKTNRRNTVALSLGLWSIMTTLSGTAKNFVQLLLARIGVGVGEAGGSPPAHAMISDYFPPEKRSTALSIYSAGIYFGVLTGFLMGGYLNQRLGWRIAFFVVGMPGIFLSLLFYRTVREPQRGATDAISRSTQPNSLRDVLNVLYSTKTFVWLASASALNVFCIYGLLNWAPSFLERLRGMTSSQAGTSLGLIYGLGGALGSFAGGLLTDHFGKKDRRWYLKVPAYAIILGIPCAAGALFLQNNALSLACLGLCAMLQSLYLGPCLSVAHGLVPASMRALTSAVYFLVINLVGLGFGPMVVGMISDLLKPSLGVGSLRWAMSVIMVISIASAACFFNTAGKLMMDSSRRPAVDG
jgi:predicted MFS family arabinose efflux permease